MAVIAWSQATQKLEDAVNSDEGYNEKYNACCYVDEQESHCVQCYPEGKGKVAYYCEGFWELYSCTDYVSPAVVIVRREIRKFSPAVLCFKRVDVQRLTRKVNYLA